MSRPLALIFVFVAFVVGCGSTRAPAVRASSVPPESRCSSYFGGGVAVAMCSNTIAQGSPPTAPAPAGLGTTTPLSITLHQPSARTGSAAGIAQAMGSALHDGERFEIGPTPEGAELLARFDISPRRALATGVFHIPPSAASHEIEAKVAVAGRDVDAQLRLGSGENLEAAYIYVPAGY